MRPLLMHPLLPRIRDRLIHDAVRVRRRLSLHAGAIACPVCGCEQFTRLPVLWPELIEEWQLSPPEAEEMDRREGTQCGRCNANLRSMALADAICAAHGFNGTLDEFVASAPAQSLQTLEINTAGGLNPTLRQMPNHRLAAYPDIDILRMPYADGTFDLVIHSDTLEHVPTPIAALAECRRVLKDGGSLCFTIPIIHQRMSRSREGLPPSRHGRRGQSGDDWLVQTEFGADAWTYVLRAGFTNLTFRALDYPTAYALIAN